MDKILINDLLSEYNKLTNCAGIDGSETIGMLAKVFIEKGDRFCEKTNFPSLEIFRRFKEDDTENLGFFIDSGEVEFTNKPYIVLVGDTHAELYYDELKTHKVILMHGATAKITAEKWGLVFVTNGKGCSVEKVQLDNSRIL